MIPDLPKVVIDTNVVVSAGISNDGNPAKIFEMLLQSRIRNYTTDEIILEIKEVMQRPRIKRLLEEADQQFIISNFENFSEKMIRVPPLNVVKEDPDDNKFVSCAVASGASFIISGDEHLLKLKEFKNIKIISPAEFLQAH